MTLLALLAGCRSVPAPPPDVVYDALGLPDCAATWDDVSVCDAIEPWASTFPEDFGADGWTNLPVRWIGAESDPYFCTDDAAEAEAWALAWEPDVDGGSHRLDASDGRWFDLVRFDAAGTAVERHRVLRCDFLAYLGPTPPGTEPVDAYARYATLPADEGDDFFPVFRELVRWRTQVLPVQVVLAFGEAHTESLHLGVCAVRCGDCEDGSGGRYRDITGVLERIDIELDPATGEVDYTVDALLEAECYARW